MTRSILLLGILAMIAPACGGDRTSASVDGGDRSDARTPDAAARVDAGPAFGASHECYGIADDDAEVFAIDRETGQATYLCAVPPGIGEIDAIASHPTTGVYYYVSQLDAELGWFAPDTCEFHPIGPLVNTELAGLAFHPETGDLYAGDQMTNELIRFEQDAAGAPTATAVHVADLPVPAKAVAIQPGTGVLFVSDADSLYTYNLTSGELGPPMPLSTLDIQALFFTKDGTLYGGVDAEGDPPDQFVRIDPVTAEVTEIGGLNPVAYLPGATEHPSANDLEAMECNVGGACSDCVE